jgi:hypothetical protein
LNVSASRSWRGFGRVEERLGLIANLGELLADGVGRLMALAFIDDPLMST